MQENKNVQRRGIKLKSPQDVQRIVRRVVNKAIEGDQELEFSGRISQLLGIWLKAWELGKLSDIEARLKTLEQAREGKR